MERRDLIISVILTLVGILFIVLIPLSTGTRAPREGWLITISPRTLPYMMAYVMTAMGLFNLIIAARAYIKAPPASKEKKIKVDIFELKTVIIMSVIMFSSVLLLGRLGYIISTALLCIAVTLFFNARWWQAILLGCLLSPIVYIIFIQVGVPLPRGILYFF